MWMANADGSDPRLLFTSERAMFALTWSPDGSKIAFIDDGLMVVEADGSHPRTLSRNFAVGYLFRPVWSPDSRTITFVAFDGPNPLIDKSLPAEDRDTDAFKGTSIHLVDVLTGAERPLIAGGTTGTIDPAWSPDGSQLVFASTRSGTSEVWAVNADGTNLHQITTMGQLVRFPSWQRPQPPAKP
ncbi:MAG TPA: hypothetical protein DEP84_32530 [Chloroflexi bacterium]|nr:hypothetical protein [Chloroflexota bacterium]